MSEEDADRRLRGNPREDMSMRELIAEKDNRLAALEAENARLRDKAYTMPSGQHWRGKCGHDWRKDQSDDCPICRAERAEAASAEKDAALRTAKQALDDWICMYAWEQCAAAAVKSARARIFENGGVLSYVASTQEKIDEALSPDCGKRYLRVETVLAQCYLDEDAPGWGWPQDAVDAVAAIKERIAALAAKEPADD